MELRQRECDEELQNIFEEIKLKSDLNSTNETADFETALERTGIGKLSYMVLWACALGLLATGFQNGVSAYLIPSAQCDLDIRTSQMGLVNVAFMIGGITSACLWGIFADTFGRRNILIVTFVLDSLVTLAGSFSQSFYFFCVTRFMSGFFIGGPGCLIFSYLGDLIPTRKRTKYICYVGFCFIMSWILLPAIALLIIPLGFELRMIYDYKFNSWRLYLLLFVIPSLASAFLFCKLPESPRLLLSNGYKQKSLEILKQIFTMNTGRPGREYSVKYLITNSEFIIKNEGSAVVSGGKMSRIFKDTVSQVTTLFKKPYAFKTFSVMFILFANMFGCYGLGLWIPELLSQFWLHKFSDPNNPSTICQLNLNEKHYISHVIRNNTSSQLIWSNKTLDMDYDSSQELTISPCDGGMDSQVFKDTMVIGMVCLLYNFLSACISEHVGVKVLPALSLAIASVSAAVFIWLSSPLYSLLAASIFQSAMMTGNIVIVGMVIDVFPPKISSMAVCVATFAGRVGAICSNLIFGFFTDISCEVPILSVAGLSLGGAFLVYFVNKDDFQEKIVVKDLTNNAENSTDYEIMDHIITHM